MFMKSLYPATDFSTRQLWAIFLNHIVLRSAAPPTNPENTMAGLRPIRLPRQWSNRVKASVLHAISLASVALSCAHGRATGRRHLRAQLDRTTTEIALLREELSIKDDRWDRSHRRRRPHYTPTQRLRILQLRAARGWTLEQTAQVFLVDLQTLLIWMRRLDEEGEPALIQTTEPVNRYPDFVRNLVRQLKTLFPMIGSERMAQVLARAGLHLGTTTIRRIVRERSGPPEDKPIQTARRRRRVVAKYPGHTWHLDLTVVPTRAGFWTAWFPFSLPQRWPFCWWIALVVDQVSRACVGFAVFSAVPSSSEIQHFLARAIRANGQTPRNVVTDKGKQFWCRSFKSFCKRRGIRPRYGRVGEPASIAIVERFIRSLKYECTRLMLVPMSLAGMRRELRLFTTWYNADRPHMGLAGKTPREVWSGRPTRRRRVEPRPKWPQRPRHHTSGEKFTLDVSYVEGRKHLPVVELRRAA
jgi:transposase InsO family protein